jgi:hypothetical protein
VRQVDIHNLLLQLLLLPIIITKSSSVRDNNSRHCSIQRIAGFAITLNYHQAEGLGFTVLAYHFLILYGNSPLPFKPI